MKFNNYYQANLVFQQGKSFIVKGSKATQSLKVFLKTGNNIVEPTLKIDKDGLFEARFEPQLASNCPFSLVAIDEGITTEISPIYCGDVFLCLGQSNMSLTLNYSEDLQKYSQKEKKHNNAYLIIGDEFVSDDGFIYRPDFPLQDIGETSKWKSIKDDPHDASAIGYILLSLLDDKVDYPVAVVVSASGGTSIDSFITIDKINSSKEIKDYLIKTDKYCEKEEKYSILSYTRTSGIFNEKVAPLLNYSFKSIIYYQGENSAFDLESAQYFKAAINLLIDSYRQLFNDDKLPVFLFGIADEYYCYGDTYGYSYITEVLSDINKENVFLVPIYDIKPKWLVKDGNTVNHPIHPSNKEAFTKRLFKIIFNNLYKGKKFLPPRIKETTLDDDKIILKNDTFDGFFEKNATFDGFFVAGADGVYKKAIAKSSGDNRIVLSSKNVKKPINYLYGLFQYSYLANCKLTNGLPLLPKRSIVEKMDKIHYQTNPIYSCDVLKIVENNFGADAGGGFPIKLWEKGSIYPCARVSTSLNYQDKVVGNASIDVMAKLNKDCFGFFSIRINLGIAGLLHALMDYPYLNIDLKSQNNVEFYGALFRYHGHINKFPVFADSQSVPLTSNWSTYSISLNNIIDGSLSPAPQSKIAVESLSSIELYFRSNEKEIELLIDNLNLSNSPVVINSSSKKEEIDMNIKIPEVSNGK